MNENTRIFESADGKFRVRVVHDYSYPDESPGVSRLRARLPRGQGFRRLAREEGGSMSTGPDLSNPEDAAFFGAILSANVKASQSASMAVENHLRESLDELRSDFIAFYEAVGQANAGDVQLRGVSTALRSAGPVYESAMRALHPGEY